jgi:hypothetical protein
LDGLSLHSFGLFTVVFVWAAAALSGPAPPEARFRGFATGFAALPSLLLLAIMD